MTSFRKNTRLKVILIRGMRGMSGKRSFQFSLRKLLLWTAVVAVLLGILKMWIVIPGLLGIVVLIILSELFE